MSTAHPTTEPAHGDHLAHHFDTPQQQAASGKLGMWLFLATEMLMFGVLFCAYSVYRGNHPALFHYAATHYLNSTLGGINTVVLISSSFTMAFAVRTVQLNQRRLAMVCLALTIAGGAGFMCVKYVEYQHKWKEGLLWGPYYKPHREGGAAATSPNSAPAAETMSSQPSTQGAATESAPSPGAAAGPATQPLDHSPAPPWPRFGSILPDPAPPPPGLAPPSAKSPLEEAAEPANVSIFFTIYFCMTGLHGLHVLVGMGLIAWILCRTVKGEFGAHYYTPVDLVGLYWHLVDLIWIFLFPLLYLIR